jgi:hypothetical protein
MSVRCLHFDPKFRNKMSKNKTLTAKEVTEYTVEQKAWEEGWKLHYDASKHLTTLNTGSILILVTFLEKLFIKPSWKGLVAVALGLFVLSIITSLLAMISIASIIRDRGDVGMLSRNVGDWLVILSPSSGFTFFVIGIICLIIFAIRNLYV